MTSILHETLTTTLRDFSNVSGGSTDLNSVRSRFSAAAEQSTLNEARQFQTEMIKANGAVSEWIRRAIVSCLHNEFGKENFDQ